MPELIAQNSVLISPKLIAETFSFQSDIHGAQTQCEIAEKALGYVSRFGAQCILSGTIPRKLSTKQQQLGHVLVNAYPREWVSRYFSKNYIDYDPTVQIAREGLYHPFSWDEIEADRLRHKKTRDLMGEAADFGLREGFTVVLPISGEQDVVFSIAGEKLELGPADRSVLALVAYLTTGRAVQLKSLIDKGGSFKISPREQLVVQLAAEGLREPAIAERLGITIHGVDKHMRSLREKLGVRTTGQLVATCFRKGLIT